MWKLLALFASALAVINFSQVTAKNCGSNPATIVLKRGEKITIEYWNPPPELDELPQHDEPAASAVDSMSANVESPAPVAAEDEPLIAEKPAVIDNIIEAPKPIESPQVEATTVRDVIAAAEREDEVSDRTPSGDAVLTVQQTLEFEQQQITTTLAPASLLNDAPAAALAEGSGSEQMLGDEPQQQQPLSNKILEASGDAMPEMDTNTEEAPAREVVIFTNFIDDKEEMMMNDDTMQTVIELESLHPVKAPAKQSTAPAQQQTVKEINEKAAADVLRTTTEAVPVDETTPVEQQLITRQEEGSGDELMMMMADEPAVFKNAEEGSGDAMMADEPAVFKNAEEGSGDVAMMLADEPIVSKDIEEGSGMLDMPEMHTFDETFTMKSLPEPAVVAETTEQTNDAVMVANGDESPVESRGDDILISRIRTIVNSLSSAKPLIRRTTGLFSSVFSRRQKRAVSRNFYATHEFKQFMRAQPLPVRRALSPNFAGRFSRKMDRSNSLVEDECDLHIKTDPGLHLLMTFHNLSAPYTVDCVGAYVEIEREGNGFEARWCGNPIGQQRGMRSHVIFARSEVRVSVFNNHELLKEKMADEKSTRHLNQLPPTGFTADIEVIDLHDAGQFTAFQRSQAYSNVKRMG